MAMTKKLILCLCSMMILLAFLAQVGATTYSFPSVQCVSDAYFNIEAELDTDHADQNGFWQLSKSAGADDYWIWENSVYGWMQMMCNESTGDEWGDALAYQGWLPHGQAWERGTMLSYPYIRVSDIDGVEDVLLLKAKLAHTAPVYTSQSEWTGLKAEYPTTGATVMLFWNVWINDTTSGSPTGPCWMFNYTDPNAWGAHDAYITEIFFTRFEYYNAQWNSVSAGNWRHNFWSTATTHDSDCHQITLNFSMPNNDQFYEFEYDVGNLLDVDGIGDIEEHYGYWHNRDIDVLGFQLMGIGLGNEVISGKWEVDWDWVRLHDNRNLTRNSEEYGFSAKTRWQQGYYYRPSYAHDWNATYNMTSFTVVKYSHTNSSCEGDANYDGYVNIFDTTLIGLKWGLNEGDDGWDYKADINPDRTINIYDLTMVSTHYDETVLWTTCGDSSTDVWVSVKSSTNTAYYVETKAQIYDDVLFDFLPTINGSKCYGDSGLGNFTFYHDMAYDCGDLSDPIVVVIKFFPNVNPSGTLNGPRLWSALHEWYWNHNTHS